MLVVFSEAGWPWLVRRLVRVGRAMPEWLSPAWNLPCRAFPPPSSPLPRGLNGKAGEDD